MRSSFDGLRTSGWLCGRRLGRTEGGPFRPADTGDQILDRHELPQIDPSQERHLEVIARLRRGPNVGLRFRQHVECAQQIFAREAARERRQPIALALRGDLGIVDARGIDRQHEQVANDARQFPAHGAQVVAHFDGAGGERKRRRGIFVGHGLHRVEQ